MVDLTHRLTVLPFAWVVTLLGVHFAATLPLLFWSYGLYDAHWVHADPAFFLPGWAALLFFAPVFIVFGALSAVWNRRGAVISAVPVLLAYFFWLGGMRASEYYAQSVWDLIGRPPLDTAVVGILTAAASALGWHLGVPVLHRRVESGERRPTKR
jgi:hypothetical protein